MAVNFVNRLHLDKDALVVGDNQLATTGGGVYVKRNLVIGGNIYIDGALTAAGFSIGANGAASFGAFEGILPIVQGGTNADNAAEALNNLGGITVGKATAISLIFR